MSDRFDQIALPGFEEMLPEPANEKVAVAEEPSGAALYPPVDSPPKPNLLLRLRLRLVECVRHLDFAKLRLLLLALVALAAFSAVIWLGLVFLKGTSPVAAGQVPPELSLDAETAALKSEFEADWLAASSSGADTERLLAAWKRRLLAHQAKYESAVRTREALVGKLVRLRRVDELYYGLLIPHDELMGRLFAVNAIARAADEIGKLRRDLVWVKDGLAYAIVVARDEPGAQLFVRFERGQPTSAHKLDPGVRFESSCSDAAPFGRVCDIRIGADSACLYRVADGKALARFPL